MNSTIRSLTEAELYLVDCIGINPSFTDLYDIAIEDDWLQGGVQKKHLTQYEVGPIPITEALKYMGIASKLSLLADDSVNSSSFITRSAIITRATTFEFDSEFDSFVVKAKKISRDQGKVRVSARLEEANGHLLMFAQLDLEIVKTFEKQHVVATQTLPSGDPEISLIESNDAPLIPEFTQSELADRFQRIGVQDVFSLSSPWRSYSSNEMQIFNHECVTHITLTNEIASGMTNILKSGLSNSIFSERSHYPTAFISAGLVTLGSRLAAGRQGLRYYTFCVQYLDIEHIDLVAIDETLELSCQFVESSSDFDVITGQAILRGEVVFSVGMGVKAVSKVGGR